MTHRRLIFLTSQEQMVVLDALKVYREYLADVLQLKYAKQVKHVQEPNVCRLWRPCIETASDVSERIARR